LPPKYSELDSDYDGQIGLYEWLVSKRAELNQFDTIDTNRDGLLTPQELKSYDESSSTADNSAMLTGYKRERLVIVGGSSGGGGRDNGRGDRGDRDRGSRGQDGSREERESSARRYFGFLDRNRDGNIDEEEWQRSRRIRSTFEDAGIPLKTMSEDEFAKNYVRATEESSGR
jgi:Ca2+-binding EF-hand superfamily protein